MVTDLCILLEQLCQQGLLCSSLYYCCCPYGKKKKVVPLSCKSHSCYGESDVCFWLARAGVGEAKAGAMVEKESSSSGISEEEAAQDEWQILWGTGRPEAALSFPGSVGQNRAEASLERAQNLNPMVDVKVDTEDIEKKPEAFFTQYDTVCLNC
ncbi:SUMO-activating enzyme subunit 1 [Microtus ochrogaster]|uniref:SUMO-activating enzyme subunit 1 n=1 Tax=Microtus ochrogaster TaxID=79684 RepID=A0A8J6KWZ6_MICOH|nr:SUMO-activating enzyme subunit 1 [Microtus ochrogaster]